MMNNVSTCKNVNNNINEIINDICTTYNCMAYRDDLVHNNVNIENNLGNPIEEDVVNTRDSDSNVENNEDRQILGLAYLKQKLTVPPRSKILAEVRCSRKILNDIDQPIIIEPLANTFKDGVLVSRAICSQEHGLFISLINFSDNVINFNKNMRVAKVKRCVDLTDTDQVCGEICYNTNLQAPEADFDHADLSWSSEINLSHLDSDTREQVEHFLSQHRDVFATSVLDLAGCDTITHTVKLTDDKPVKCKAYRVPHHLRKELDSQLDILLQADIIEPSMSEYASPVILVKKSDGTYRLAVDFRKLNKKLIKDAYPIPNITDSVDALAGSKFFTTLDLTSGFFQQVLDPEDRHKTAIITHRGLHQFKRNCFGLSNSGPNFQRLMNAIFGDLGNLGILVYIDDIIVTSDNIQSHFKKLTTVFDRLRKHKLKLKPNKCVFLANKIKYLGFEIHSGQVSPINKNIEVIENFKLPNSRKAVRSFIGTVSFYRKFLPDFSKRAKNLINLTKDTGKFKWTEEAQKEFNDLKKELISKPCLALPNFSKEFHLYTDASGEALGAVLSQMDDNNMLHPVAFASKKLKQVESRYSATERELLALVWATSHFKCYLANAHFYLYTDHAPLTFMLKIQDPTSRMAKWICTLSDFQFTIKYVQGKCNSVADFLSRFVNNNNSPAANTLNYNFCVQYEDKNVFIPQTDLLEKIKRLQKTDFKCCQIARKLDKNENIKPNYLNFFFKDDLLVCEDTRSSPTAHNVHKLVVPKQMVPQVFALTHESLAACHQGFQKTLDRIREHFYWPGMSMHVKNLIDSCVSCQQRRAHKANQLAPLQRMPTPQFPNSKIHVDCLGPFPQTLSGNRFVITYIDAFSKWPEAYAVPSITSDAVADTLADFVCRYGSPNYITTDRGKNFMSQAIEKVYKSFGITHISTTPYHPSSNAKIERFHRTLANALSHIVSENQIDWDSKLKFALLAIRTSVHSSTKLTPATVMYGRNLNLPYALFAQTPHFSYNDAPSYCEVIIPALQKIYMQVHNNLVTVAENQEKYREKTAVVKNIKIGDSVWLYTPAIEKNHSKKLSKCNSGPYTVLDKLTNVNFKIAPLNNLSKCQVVHVDRLTLAVNRLDFGEEEDRQTLDVSCGSGVDNSMPEEMSIDDRDHKPEQPVLRRQRRRFFAFPAEGNFEKKRKANVNTGSNSATGYQEQPEVSNGETQLTSEIQGETSNENAQRTGEQSSDLQVEANNESENHNRVQNNQAIRSRRGRSGVRNITARARSESSSRYPLRKVKSRNNVVN